MKIAVFYKKHENDYYLLESEEDWYRICMQEFQDRDEVGYFPTEKPEEPSLEEPEKPDPMPEWAEKEYEKELSKYNGAWAGYRRDLGDWELYEKARNGSLEAAAEIIEIRGDYEYEGYDVISPIEVSDDIPQWEFAGTSQEAAFEYLLDQVANRLENSHVSKLVRQIEGDLEKTSRQKPYEESDSRPSIPYKRRTKRKIFRHALNRVFPLLKDSKIEEAQEIASRVLKRYEDK